MSLIQAELCVYGGTSAGVIAAVQAAALGKRVVLVEAGQHLGGMSVEGLGGTDIDNHKNFQNSPAVGGLAREFYHRIRQHYKRQAQLSTVWRFEPHVAEMIFESWVKEAGVTVLRGHRLKEKGGVRKDGAKITALHFENGAQVQARVFIDATYEGDLLAFAGVRFTVGREGNAQYGETKNGIRMDTTHSQLDKRIDPYKTPGDPKSGLIHGVSAEAVGKQGAPSPAIQGFSFRLCLTKNPANRLPIEKPASYDPAHYELQRRYRAAGGVISPPGASLPNGKTDPGSWHPLAGFLTGENHRWNTASYTERERLLRQSREYVQGLHWLLCNEDKAWAEWGLCKDEFTDNGGWPRMFYVRNGRRMLSDFVMTEAHGRKQTPEPVPDPVGLVWWPHDLHNARRLVREGAVWNEGAVFDESLDCDWVPFGIAYRALVPKARECTNLLCPTCPSMSYVAYGAFRIEFTFMVAAQSAAIAAALALEEGLTVQNVSYARLRERLLKAKQVLEQPS